MIPIHSWFPRRTSLCRQVLQEIPCLRHLLRRDERDRFRRGRLRLHLERDGHRDWHWRLPTRLGMMTPSPPSRPIFLTRSRCRRPTSIFRPTSKKPLGSSFTFGQIPADGGGGLRHADGLASATDTDSDGYLEYGSDEYKKVTGAPYGSGYKSAFGNVTFANGDGRITSRSSRSSGGSSPARGRRPAS
jgi:hypothetical protein